jgi:membrane-associated phospholipid phosphatase
MGNLSSRNIPDRLAKIISGILHPLFMPLYGLIILLSAPTFLSYLPSETKKIIFLIVFINNVFIPMVMLPFFRYRNIISSYALEDKSERTMPLLITSILYCTTSFIVFRFQIPFFLKSFIFAISVLSIIVSMINFWWKISIHSVGAGVLVAIVFILSFKLRTSLIFYLALVILAGGLVLSSRLRLNAHNPSQVWAGFASGFLVISLFMLLI